MWVFTRHAFLSIVAYKEGKEISKKLLLVRARGQGDIQRVFPNAKVRKTVKADYQFRATVSKEDVAVAMYDAVKEIQYTNFKDSVKSQLRHKLYTDVWMTIYSFFNRHGAFKKKGSGWPYLRA